MRCMRRTNIYLSDEQRTALAARAATDGTTVAAVVRRLIDRALSDDGDDLVGDITAIEASFGVLRGADIDIDRGDGVRGEHLESMTRR